MDDKSNERETSRAKSVELESDQQKVRDRAESLKEAFERAKAAQGKSMEQQKAAAMHRAKTMQREGSGMVKGHAPGPEPKAPQNVRKAQKEQTHIKDLADDHREANQKNAEAEAAYKKAQDRLNQQKLLGKENDRNKDNDDRSR